MNKSSLAAALALLICLTALAQSQGEQPDSAVDPQVRLQVIESALRNLDAYYVFPEVAKQMEAAIRARLTNMEYDRITSAKDLAASLTAHLQDISHDKHLRVVYRVPPPQAESTQKPTPQDRESQREFVRSLNFGFERAERLDGNIGYLDLRGFMDPGIAGDTAASAMSFLANTDALIIDLRSNGGGTPAMAVLLASYIFDAQPVHYADNYARAGNTTRQWWTLPYVPGKRYGASKPVYILTSRRTFSAAEGFAYHLKSMKRATIVGETTGGGANLTESRRIGEHFILFVPTGRGINPITGTNWEGVGVKPDIDVPAAQALKAAHIDALNRTLEKATDPRRTAQIKSAIEGAMKELDDLKKK